MTDKQIITNLTAKLEAATKPKWISVHDMMPPIGEEVLIRISCANHFNIESAKLKADGTWLGCWCDTYGKAGSSYQVNHWMPKPQDPKED